MRVLAFLAAAAALLTLESCATPPAPVARPPGVSVAPPPPRVAPAPAPAPLPADWRDWPFSPGTWTYRPDPRGSIAVFGLAGGNPEVILRCDRATQNVSLSRIGHAGGTVQMTVRTTFGTLTWPAEDVGATPSFVAARRNAADAGLDQIAYSRGRFTLELPGMAPLVLRPWAEVGRVVEDCRGS